MNTSVIEAIERQKTTNLYDASKSIPDDEIGVTPPLLFSWIQ
jgi:hypothetical protein